MADDVTLPGTGVVVAADDVGSVFFQKIKVDWGGDGVSVPAVHGSGNATGALRVELPTNGTGVVGLNAGSAHVGAVGGHSKTVIVTPTIDSTPDYSDGDLLGDKLTVAAVGRANDGSGEIRSVLITSDVDIAAGIAIDVLFFNADPSGTTFTDNSAIAVAVADLHFLIGVVRCDIRYDLGTPVCLMPSLPPCLPFVCASGTDDLYACLVARGTINFGGTADINLVVGVSQD